MKVTGKQSHEIVDLSTKKARDARNGADPARTRSAAERGQAAANRTTLSTVDRIKQSIRETPDVRSERVAEIKAKLRSGDLKIDAENLAGKMLTNALAEDIERP